MSKSEFAAILTPTATQRAFWIFSGDDYRNDAAVLVVNFAVDLPFDHELINSAWKRTISQHDMLRASINPDKSDEPLLVIRVQSPQNVTVLTDSTAPVADVNLAKAPTHKLYCRHDGNRINFVWHCHHALLDGWSAHLVLNDLVRNYSQLLNPQAANDKDDSTKLSYINAHRLLLKLDITSSQNYWEEYLQGFKQPALLTHAASSKGVRRVSTATILQQNAAQELNALCKASGVTTACVIQMLWSYIISILCLRDDVVIGTAVSGRPPAIPNIETVAGCFATVAPARVHFDRNLTIKATLQKLQIKLFEAAEHQFIGLQSIIAELDNDCNPRLFDSLLVVESFPETTSFAGIPAKNGDRSAISNYQSDVVSSYPLTVTISPATDWTIRCDFQDNQFNIEWIESLQHTFCGLLETVIENWQAPLSSIDKTVESILTEHPNPIALQAGNSHGVLKEQVFDTLEGPVNDVELEMIALWEEVLHLRPVSMDARFFDIGGTSLHAVTLIERVSKALNYRIPASLFLGNPTPRACAAFLLRAEESPAPMKSLVPLNKAARENSREPGLYCLHSGGGHAMFYREFAQRLPGQTPCFALQPRGIDGREAPDTSVKEMASHYLAEIKSQNPDGPYHLLCYCLSGALVLEMAHQLKKQGLQAGHLIIVDAPSPVPAAHPVAKLGWSAYLIYELVIQRRWDMLQSALKHRVEKKKLASASEPGQHKALSGVQQACKQGFTDYRAKPTDLPVTFLQNTGALSQAIYMRNWPKLTPNANIISIDGDHRFLFDLPEATNTAKIIGSIISSPCHAPETSGVNLNNNPMIEA